MLNDLDNILEFYKSLVLNKTTKTEVKVLSFSKEKQTVNYQ